MPPQEQLPVAIDHLCDLNPDSRESLIAYLRDSDPAISLDELARATASNTNIDGNVIRTVLDALWRLVGIAVRDPSFVAVATSYMVTLGKAASLSDQDRGILSDQLRRLLLCERSIALSGKAQAVMWGHGRLFQAGHVITQVRPLFFTDLDQKATTSVIVHELRIDFRQSDLDSELCVAMDRAQVKELIAVLSRALHKEDNLRRDNAFNYLLRPE